MSDDPKAEYYRLLDHLEAAESQLEGLEQIGPIEDLQGNPLWPETEPEKTRLRAIIDKLSPRLAKLRKRLDA